MRLLSQVEHTARQLKLKLLKKGFEPDQIDRVLSELSRQNLLSDERFAEQYIAMRAARGFGPVRIEQEMREKGVSEALITQVMTSYAENWSEIMARALYKKFGGAPVINFSERARRARFLEYRGFPGYLIRQQLFED